MNHTWLLIKELTYITAARNMGHHELTSLDWMTIEEFEAPKAGA